MSTVVVYLSFLLFLPSTILTEKQSALYSKFQQNDYEIKFEWADVTSYNKNYLKEFRGTAFKHNRTCTAMNLTFHYDIEIGNNLEVVVQVYKFLSNEYREFPIRMQLNFCVAVKHNLIGSHQISECGNFFGCPIKKGVRYEICKFVPDQSQFPPMIPSGRYKLTFQGLYHNTEMFLANAYGEVYRPIQWK